MKEILTLTAAIGLPILIATGVTTSFAELSGLAIACTWAWFCGQNG